MLKKSTGLGRGLDALLTHTDFDDINLEDKLSTNPPPTNTNESIYTQHLDNVESRFVSSMDAMQKMTTQSTMNTPTNTGNLDEKIVRNLQVSLLAPMKDQPRQTFNQDTLDELASSIKTYGIIQPLVVNETNNGRYKIIAGERRWRAAQLAGLETVPCIVRNEQAHNELEIALIENIQREELNAVDEARTLQKLVDEHNYSQETLATRIGKDRTTVSNSLRLLSLPNEILEDLQQKKLTAGHARALCSLDDKKSQLKVRDVILDKKLSVRQTEEFVKNLKKDSKNEKPLKDSLPPDLRNLCDQFKGHLGTKVRISGSSERGKIEISYYTLEDLDRIAELVLGNSWATRIS